MWNWLAKKNILQNVDKFSWLIIIYNKIVITPVNSLVVKL